MSEQGTTNGTGVTIRQQIRWGDQDAMGHVNNIVYFQYCESARLAYGDVLDLQSIAGDSPQNLGMVAANLNFRRQLHYPGEVEVTAHATRVGGKSFTLSYVITDLADGVVAAEGDSVCVWVDYAKAEALPLPDVLVARIREVEGDTTLGA